MSEQIEGYAQELHAALRGIYTVPALMARDSTLTIDNAYAISLRILALRLAEGERVVGKKIGATSKVVQDMLGVNQPDFGFLTDKMLVSDIVNIKAQGLIQPRIEAEIAFVLKSDLKGTDLTEADILAATASIAPCFEVVDSRIDDWKIGIIDTIADNASCGVFALGAAHVDPHDYHLPSLQAVVYKNGEQISTGFGSAVQGSPLTAVAWLANRLGRYDVALKAGDVILSGGLLKLEPVAQGNLFEMELIGIGRCALHFT